MDIHLSCDGCGQDIVVDESAAGTVVQCPTCIHNLTVPLCEEAAQRRVSFRFIDGAGREMCLSGLAEITECVKSGQIKKDTLLFDESRGLWKPASEVEVYRGISTELEAAVSDEQSNAANQSNPPNADEGKAAITEQNPAGQADAGLGVSEEVSSLPDSVVENVKFNQAKRWSQNFRHWRLVLIASSFLLVGVASSFYRGKAVYGVAPLAGDLPWVGFVSLLVAGAFHRKKGIGTLFFSWLLFAVACYRAGQMSLEESQAKAALLCIESNSRNFLAGGPIESRDVSTVGDGSAARIAKWYQEFLIQLRTDVEGIQAEVRKCNLEEVLKIETLKGPEDILLAQQAITWADKINKRAEMQFKKRLADGVESLSRMDLPKAVREIAINGYKKRMPNALQSISDWFVTERAGLDVTNKALGNH
ncbi:MAG: hypothetical protein NTY01_10270 [Verrucomicrobia bacterium]|nr:hypothetical protein [Verrucomicrobiota bacterium]